MSSPAIPAAGFLISNFLFAYFMLASRLYRQLLGFTHNSCPREDIAVYGDKMVLENRITEAQLRRVKRWDACQANSVEGFPLFVAATLFGLLAPVSYNVMIGIGAGYTCSRILYAVAYIAIEDEMLSYVRSVFWWAGNAVCFWGIVEGARGFERV